ncbi:pyrimidine dimer DNA glycosylase /DNA-(apurinic or apyrimidinic site) lyase [Leucobacter sp. Psy1]|uniref:pyrimidine dimer DNA glycosylase/endonuclease V n=1 Tax=Leucobacter sp. Psy1 TaxID=2875729 RepID=UPI001CD5EF0C|nr:pyrimidine dimer DNA glycosylase/endonuclease V [Leucobacter sp. Psy1]UBH05949.1 pyrimidine dimer DNA glycosylase /DNA-(apurinic or apyrimidinic site) lyase [Leucobacter sp. Psy1]
MRLWSLHPRQLDRVGLVACWRESLLAQNVLAGKTRGYRNHPQLTRFRATEFPLNAVGAYLVGLQGEATRRGYRFNEEKILDSSDLGGAIPVTNGQLAYEWEHLGRKFEQRSPELVEAWRTGTPEPHPLFAPRPGGIEEWERP